ncbi:Glutathione synthetase [Rhizina undulata]
MFPPYPPPLSPPQKSFLVESLIDYALSHGVTVRAPPPPPPPPPPAEIGSPGGEESGFGSCAVHAPVAVFPSPFPRACWERARSVQTAFNELYIKVACDEEWLGRIVDELSAVDEFIARLRGIQISAAAASPQRLSLGLFRSDYMLHQGDSEERILQVEFNTIASSFGGLASRVSEMHRHLVSAGAYPPALTHENIPLNPAAEKLAGGLAMAHRAYIPVGAKQRETGVLFVVQAGERNVFDQRWLEYPLLTQGIYAHRITLEQVRSQCFLETGTKALVYKPPHRDGEVEVSTVYFRAGYGPGDYTTDADWAARALLEESNAIKCPSVVTQLAGSKKVQQVLCNPGELEHFFPDSPETVGALRETFARIYPMDTTPLGLEARALAFKQPARYVLKPQREGGGNNVYKERIPGFLEGVEKDKWGGYVLMELIEPPELQNLVLRDGVVREGEVVGELGVYGIALWGREGAVVGNEEAGWLLRTKGRESEEGGVAAGFGCVDGVLLV